MSTEVIFAVGVAGVLSLLAPFALRSLLIRWDVFDVPNHRSSHKRPTLRGGGIAPLLGLAIGGVLLLMNPSADVVIPLVTAFVAAIVVAFVGLVEDIKGLPITIRAGLQLCAGAAIGISVVTATQISWLWIPFVALVFTYHVNATNFMDGVNGISALHGAVVGSSFAVIGLLHSLPWLTGSGMIIAVCYAAFLPWNLLPPGMFLGDVGSYLLGSSIAGIIIIAVAAGVHPLAAIGPVCIYWADTAFTLIRRLFKGEPIFQAHRSHAYQRLTDAKLSHIQVSTLVALFSTLTAATGLAVDQSWISPQVAIIILVVLMAGYLTSPRIFGFSTPQNRSYELPRAETPAAIAERTDWRPENWVVLGGSGFIGSEMVKHLQKAGHTVVSISAPRLKLTENKRTPGDVALLAEGVEAEKLEQLFRGADVVVNAAGVAKPVGDADDSLYGANALLPTVIAVAARNSGVPRVIHLSSAAVQGSRKTLDSSTEVAPFSPYSHSKALGELALIQLSTTLQDTDLVIVRATSVQGVNRDTTRMLKRIARSPLSSVAFPGTQPTVVSSVDGLCEFVENVGRFEGEMEAILLQPWEGLSVRDVLELAGDKTPVVLPRWICRTLLTVGQSVGFVIPRAAGLTRRVELMWFGQNQEPAVAPLYRGTSSTPVRSVLSQDVGRE